MRKLIFCFAALALAAGPQSADADDVPPFGDDLLNWVNHEAGASSVRLAKSDLISRVQAFYVLSTEKSLEHFAELSVRLDQIEREMADQEKLFPSARPIVDALYREQQSRKHLRQLRELYSKIEKIGSLVSFMNATPTHKQFLERGLQNVGRQTFYQSIEGLRQTSDRLRGQYPIGVRASLTVDSGGNFQSYNPGFYDDSNRVHNAMYTAGGYLLQYAQDPASKAVGAVLIAVPLALAAKDYREFKEQEKKARRAFEILPEKLITVPDVFKEYKDQIRERKKQFSKIIDAIRKSKEQILNQWRIIYTVTVARSRAADRVLTEAAIQQVADQFGADTAISAAVGELKILRQRQQIIRYRDRLRTRFSKLLDSCANEEGFIAAEDLKDSELEARTIFKGIVNQGQFAPLKATIELILSEINRRASEIGDFDGYVSNKVCDSASVRTVDDDASETGRNVAFARLPSESTNIQLVAARGSRGGGYWVSLGFCFMTDSREKYLCGGAGGPGQGYYADLYPSGGRNPISDVLGGLGDGGLKFQGEEFSFKLEETKEKLIDREKTLKEAFEKTQKIIEPFLRENLEKTDKEIKKKIDSFSKTLEFKIDFENRNRPILGQWIDTLNQRTQGEFSPTDLLGFETDKKPTDMSFPNLKPDVVLPDNPPISGISLRQRVYAKQAPNHRSVVRETRKQSTAFRAHRNRFQDYRNRGQQDPVYESIDQLNYTQSVAQTDLSYALSFAEFDPDMSRRLGPEASNLSDRYLDQAQRARLFSANRLNYLNRRNDLDLIFTDEVRSTVTTLANEFEQCSFELQNYQCNIFVSRAVSSIYGIEDFVTTRNFGSFPPKANSMIKFMARNKKWKKIGVASNQDNLNYAGLQAAKGKAVIATFYNDNGPGHVSVILPGTPVDTSTSRHWRGLRFPRLANFSLNNPSRTGINMRMSAVFSDPREVVIFVRDYD